MNFTDQYIKMCDCDEIRAHRTRWKATRDPVCYELVNGLPLFVPLQYQIQQLIFQYGSCQYKLLSDFYDWCTEYRKKDIKMVKGCTLEELWLMFYMWRDHYKTWDGEKWIKE